MCNESCQGEPPRGHLELSKPEQGNAQNAAEFSVAHYHLIGAQVSHAGQDTGPVSSLQGATAGAWCNARILELEAGAQHVGRPNVTVATRS